jgi:uncharacterized protein DUF5677
LHNVFIRLSTNPFTGKTYAQSEPGTISAVAAPNAKRATADNGLAQKDAYARSRFTKSLNSKAAAGSSLPVEWPGVYAAAMGKAARKKKLKYQKRTPLSGHKREGRRLDPPFVQFGLNKRLVSWMNDRLPEMIWAALLIAALGRDAALAAFRQFLRFIAEHPNRELFYDGTLTGFANLGDPVRNELIGFLCRSSPMKEALAPLMLFDGLPARETWQEKLKDHAPGSSMILMEAVRLTLFHQSQEATDCRWVRLMCGVFGGRVIVPPKELQQLNGYPNLGDQRTVRPSIRAAESGMDMVESRDLSWAKAFWSECWEKTPCMARAEIEGEKPVADVQGIALGSLLKIRRQLEAHWENTHSTTAIDARHDAVFGMAFYAIRLTEETLSLNHGRTVLGRLALRTFLEIHVTLRHLLQEDSVELWRSWRAYGVGQAKLASLKVDESEKSPPHYLDADVLKDISNEDFWEEVVSVDLGHWTRADLRKLSEKVNLKDAYDRYYGWTSGFSHAHWGPIRESIYRTCLNPLHRGHRCPRVGKPVPLPDIRADIGGLLNSILSDLDHAYPGFAYRLYAG